MWTHRDIVDCAFTLADLIDIHELLDVRDLNEHIAIDWKEQHAK